MNRKIKKLLLLLLCVVPALLICSCGRAMETSAQAAGMDPTVAAYAAGEVETVSGSELQPENDTEESAGQEKDDPDNRTDLIAEQILEGETGTIHYSYYLPEDYDPQKKYPLVMTMPGYDMMWFGENSSGANLSWGGFLCWTDLPEEMIVVSAQLTDWHENSARQAIELTEYFIDNFSVDTSRIYAAGYSAGGETMSQAVSLRPDLYAAYLHGASQWDGDYAPIAENGVAVYIFMAEHDEYYGSERAWSAYDSLHDAYEAAGWSDEQIDSILQIQTPDDAWFARRGITGNYHGGGNEVFEEGDILNWILSHSKEERP